MLFHTAMPQLHAVKAEIPHSADLAPHMVSESGDRIGLAFGLTIMAGLCTTIGSSSAFFSKLRDKRILAIGLGLSGGVMIYVSFMEILAVKAIDAFEEHVGEKYAGACATLGFFGGMLVCAGLDVLVHRMGHSHGQHPLMHGTDFGITKEDMRPPNRAPEEEEMMEMGSVDDDRLGHEHAHKKADSRGSYEEVDELPSQSRPGVNAVTISESVTALKVRPAAAAAAADGEEDDIFPTATPDVSRALSIADRNAAGEDDGPESNVLSLRNAQMIESVEETESPEATDKEHHHEHGHAHGHEADHDQVHAHGHGHGHGHGGTSAADLNRTGLITALTIAIHNFPEGLATFVATLDDPSVGVAIAIAIAIHNVPEGICVAMPIVFSTGNRAKAFWWSFLSGMTEPVGAGVGYFLLRTIFGPAVYGTLFSLVSGMMVYISFKELLPTARKYDVHDRYVTTACVFGMLIMSASLVLFQIA